MQRMITLLLWTALVATLAGTVANTTWAFGTVNGGSLALGALQAAAADLGLVALAATLAVRRSAGERARWLWCAVGGFVVVSTYASYLHSYAQATPLDAPGASLRPLLLGAFLPLMLFALVEVVSHARRPIALATHDAPTAALVPEQGLVSDAHDAPDALSEFRIVASVAQEEQEPVAVHANGNGHQCDGCNRTFATRNALTAHKRFCPR